MKNTNKTWFVYVRRSYLPASWQGLGLYLLYVAYSIAIAIDWYKRGHTLWELLTEVIPLFLLATLLAQFVASKNSNK